MCDNREWDIRLLKWCKLSRSIEIEMFSVNFSSTLGRIVHTINFEEKDNKTFAVWTISYTSDLCQNVLKSM
jgi:hypothetical protein